MPSKIQKQLRQDIKNLVNELNAELTEYYQSGEKVEIFETAIETSAQKARGRGRAGGLSKGWNLNKISDLRSYKQELQRLKNFNMFTPAAERRQEQLQEKAFRQFSKNHPGFTREQYNNMADVFKMLPEALKNELGSEQIVEIAQRGFAKGYSAETIGEIILKKYQKGEENNLDVETVNLSILNSIKYGRRNR